MRILAPRARAAGTLAAAASLLAAGRARAALTIDHVSGVDSCTEAASYFPEDVSPDARSARMRCRLEIFDQKMEQDRQRREGEGDRERQKNVDTWMQKQDIPARVLRRNSVDLFLSGGLASYGVAVGGVLLPWLEGELWAGKRTVSETTPTGYFWDSRTCYGGRLKWLMVRRGNLTPFLSLGAAGCPANVQLQSFGGPGPVFDGSANPNPTGGNASAIAHLGTATAGAAWMEKSGLRISLEYLFAYAFYTQATLNDDMKTQDPNMRAAWEKRLTADRFGFRLQVGYAF